MMTKQDIKAKWGKYCDTDKLIDDMMALLTKYNHRNTEHGVCKVLDEFFTNKEPMIQLFEKSANYKGNLRISFMEPFVRDRVASDIRHFVDTFRKQKKVADCILSYKDEKGKTVNDYIRTGATHMDLKHMAKAKDILHSADVVKFSKSGATVETEKKKEDFDKYMSHFLNTYDSAINTDYDIGEVKIAKGTKTSRAFNKVCTHYGVDKWNQYNKEFAKYADMVSGKDRMLTFFISVNPLDYLTMSFGKSWASCHTIDKRNYRRMPGGYSGQYCNGTMSYMLDSSSIVTFVFDDIKKEIHEEGKLYRNMFHVNLDTCKFIQGRIYPAGNDGSTDLYAKFRHIIQREFTPLLGLNENKWKLASGMNDQTESFGSHYRDYLYNNGCKAFYPTEKGSNGAVKIGHLGVCPHCGEEYHGGSGALAHYSCVVVEPVVEPTVATPEEIADATIEAIDFTIDNTTIHELIDSVRVAPISVNWSNDLNYRYVTFDTNVSNTFEISNIELV